MLADSWLLLLLICSYQSADFHKHKNNNGETSSSQQYPHHFILLGKLSVTLSTLKYENISIYHYFSKTFPLIVIFPEYIGGRTGWVTVTIKIGLQNVFTTHPLTLLKRMSRSQREHRRSQTYIKYFISFRFRLNVNTGSCTFLESPNNNCRDPKLPIIILGFAIPCVALVASDVAIYLKVNIYTFKLKVRNQCL